MFKALMIQLLKKGLYALIAVVISVLTMVISGFHPEGEMQQIIWTAIAVPLLTGLVALLKRWAQWDPEKAPK